MTRQSAILIGNQSLLLQCAERWLGRGHSISAVVTRAADIADWAEKAGLPVEPYGPDLATRLMAHPCDWLLSIANLTMLPAPVLALPRLGAVNFHDGPLPGYAGLNAPVWALLAGETRHAVTWHMMEAGIDTGDVLAEAAFDISAQDTALTLNTRCFEAAIGSFETVMTELETGCPSRRPQDAGPRAVYARAARPPAAARLDFRRDAADLQRMVRALDHGGYDNPVALAKLSAQGHVFLVRHAEVDDASSDTPPGTVLEAGEGTLTVATGQGALRISSAWSPEGVDLAQVAPVGAALDLLDPAGAEDLTQAMQPCAQDEPFWRARLEGYAPVVLPFVSPSQGAPNWTDAPLEATATPDQILQAAAIWAMDLTQSARADLALSVPARPQGYVLPWRVLSVRASETMHGLRGALDADLARVMAKAPIPVDLFARMPAMAEAATPALSLDLQGGGAPTTGAILHVGVSETGWTIQCDRSRLSPAAQGILIARFAAVLQGVQTAPDHARPSELVRMPDSERDLLLHGWSHTQTPANDAQCIHELFEAQVARTPDEPALISGADKMSYADLNAAANRAAHVLRAMGVTAGTCVALCTRRGPSLMIGALAILKAGGAYVPLDPDYPADRLQLYLEDSGAPIVVTESGASGAVPATGAAQLVLDTDLRLADAPVTDPTPLARPDTLAYLIYTSGSTGRPKGVMVEHRNVANFFTGMDDRITASAEGAWMAVTSLSFDISVLELFYTLARGFKVVLAGDGDRLRVSDGPLRSGAAIDFSLFYWGNDDGVGPAKYQLLLEGAKYADQNGFAAIWTPERHFHAFGGPYPNPSVTGAAVAAVTQNLDVRAGSCVTPLHHPARIAEEWAVIDNLTNGRAGLAVASGWQPDDFVLRPENTPPNNKPAMLEAIDTLRALWRGDAVPFPRADGTQHQVVTQPRPVSKDLPIWVTTAGNPQTWTEAGTMGAHVLTHLLGQSIDEVAEKIKLYRAALSEAGHDPAMHKVTLMLHTFVGEDRDTVREIAREPMKEYLRSAAGLIKQYAWAFPAFKKPKGAASPFDLDLGSLSEDELEGILDFAFQRYFDESGLFGTVDDCVARTEALKHIGVDEVACLIDYGIPVVDVLEGLRPLAQVLHRSNQGAGPNENDFSIAGQIVRHGVTHLQCTPSMARMIASDPHAKPALAQLNQILIGGEALPGRLVRDIRHLTEARIENMYGPTETTIWSSSQAGDADAAVVGIGTPIANTQMYVLDGDLAPVPVGAEGELFIGGHGVTRGYWQRADLTSDRFLPDPFVDTQQAAPAGARMYRTGDLVRWTPEGQLEFLGRVDHQVKIRGHRIELGEIEARISARPDVTQAVVIAREDAPGDVRLIAYVTGPGATSEAAIRTQLAANLPEIMVPARVVVLDAFPLTPNKKVDRNALPAPGLREKPPVPAPVPTKGAGGAEAEIAAIWGRILGVARVGPSDNFFDLGGHSLLAVQAHREIRDSLGVPDLSITDIFQYPTLDALAARIGARPETIPQPAERAPVDSRAAQRADAMARRRQMRARRRA